MNNTDVSLENLTPWQLVNSVYEALLIETNSLINLVTVPFANKDDARKAFAKKLDIKNKILELIRYLESLLEVDEEFSLTMHSLYGWYRQNLDLLLESDADSVEPIALNLQAQANGFLEIWEGARR